MSAPGDRPPVLLEPELLQRLGRLDLIGRAIADAWKQGLRRSRLHGFSTEFSDYKPYTPGDDLRFLDWRIYARTDRLLVRKYEAETSFESMLLLDASPSMSWRWGSAVTKLEYAANLLAAIAHLHIEAGDAVGIAAGDGGELEVVPPRSTRLQLDRLFAALARLRPRTGSAIPRLAGVLEGLRKHRGQLVLCSDLEEDPEEVGGALEALAGRGDDVVVLHVLDRAEIDLPFGEVTHIEDSETGEVLPVELDDLRRTRDGWIGEFRERWRARCEGWGFRYRPVDTGMEYLEVLLGLARGTKA